jgi:hypothetical protein
MYYRRLLNKNYEKVNEDYSISSNTVLFVTRPFDYPIYYRLYPMVSHAFLRTDMGDYGYQFCYVRSNQCPDRRGPEILPEDPQYPAAKDKSKYEYWLITEDSDKSECIKKKMFEEYKNYNYRTEFHSVAWNACYKYLFDVLNKCGV